MSEILVNKLTGTSTAGSILVTGEGNSTTTNLQQGLAKAYISFSTDNPTSVRGSFNTSSVTDNGTGDTTIAINNNMANINYAIPSQLGDSDQSDASVRTMQIIDGSGGTFRTTSVFRTAIVYSNVGSSTSRTYIDQSVADCVVHGDLA